MASNMVLESMALAIEEEAGCLIESIEECPGGRSSSGVPSGVQECANDVGG
jgi:hypothetical protein